MQHPEYNADIDAVFKSELDELQTVFTKQSGGITGLFGNGAVRVPAEGDDPPPSRPRRAGHGRKR
jgi:hypothetical protein